MIQKSVFQKRINSSIGQIQSDQNKICPNIKNFLPFKDVSNSVQSPSKVNKQLDYKTLYEQQKMLNEEIIEKIDLLKQKIVLLQTENKELKEQLLQPKQSHINPISQHNISLPKKSHKQILFQEIHSFKKNLPNSMKVIEFQELENFDSVDMITDQQIISKKNVPSIKALQQNCSSGFKLSQQKSQKSINNSTVTLKLINDDSLIDCLAMYGLSQEVKIDQEYEDEEYYEGELTYCSKAPHQIVKHSSKLVFPNKTNKTQIEFYSDQDAIQQAVSIISQTLKSQEMKAFTLIFQPASFPNEKEENQLSLSHQNPKKDVEIIDMINKERRFYAISIAFQDFDVVKTDINQRFPSVSFENSIQENIFHINIKQIQLSQQKSQSYNVSPIKQLSQNSLGENEETFTIRVSRKVITFFTKYPFIHFFEELLVNCIKESFECRKNEMKKNISNIKSFDHTKTIDFLKVFYQNMNEQYKFNKKFESKINEIFQIQFLSSRLNRYERLSLELSKTLLKNFYSEIWAYPVLKLFTLDNFLDVFTLVLLEEKIIFVCENESILTSAIFLFTKVFMKPFDYPYPVVSIIPNEYDYFNAPFPIVYGCLNSKDNLVRDKIPKIYKNVYIILTPSGVQILANKNAIRLQSRKSPKLRDKLLPYFLKMETQQKAWNLQKNPPAPRFSGLGSFLGFGTSVISTQSQFLTKKKFNFSNNNRQLTHQIIQRIHSYLSSIKDQIPSKQKVNQIKAKIQDEIQEANTPQSQNIDIEKETYERVKSKMLKKTSDPFVQKFLETQIVGLEILR